MIKIIFMLKRKPGTTPEQFRDHYENSHVKLAQKYIGHLLKDYNRNYPTFTGLDPSGGEPKPYDTGYDCITEMMMENQADVDEMTRIFNDPEINPILVEDELKFLDKPSTVMIVVDKVDTGTKLAA